MSTAIGLAKKTLLKKLSAGRTFGNLVGLLFLQEDTGIDHDLKPEIFRAMSDLTPERIADFAAKKLAAQKYDIFAVGPTDKLDRKKLEAYGEVIQVKPEQIFGY